MSAPPVEPRVPARPRARKPLPSAVKAVDVGGLEGALRRVLPPEDVLFDDGARALYATDASNYRQVPLGVVRPHTAEDIEAVVRACREHGAPVLSRGGGTSLAGQCCNVAVVMDHSRHYGRLLSIDPERRLARVQPGIVLDDLRDAAVKQGLTFGPDPATHNRCTLGGMLGNNSCGMHAQMAGRCSDNVEALEVLTYDGLRLEVGATSDAELARLEREGGRVGELYRGMRALRDRYADLIRRRYPKIPRRVSGYNLDDLLPEKGFHVARALVGSEGTLVTILEATLRLIPNPRMRTLLVLGYPDVYRAGDHVARVVESGPIALEGLDDQLIEGMRRKGLNVSDLPLLPEGRGWLMVEYGGDSKEEADGKARRLMEALEREHEPPSMSLFDDPAQETLLWEVRESGLGATARVPGEPDSGPGWEDAAVPPEKVGGYLRDFRALLDRYGYRAALYGHFGQGCVHCRISFDLREREGVQHYRHFVEEAADLVVRYGGSLSGEHGDGQSRAELLPRMFGDELVRAMGEFKALWDPRNRMNPHKVVAPYRLDEHLRLGPTYAPRPVHTEFEYPGDRGSFERAITRCVGVGLCRRHDGGTMCPSYRVTREEKHSTRGRAHLLFEMLRGDPVGGGWQSEEVKDALDLCLACKGCKSDCPVNVDMATYKAEFLSHYYEGRLRPRNAYAFGFIMFWARAASLAPRLVNTLTQSRVLAPLARRLAGVHPARRIPAFARRTLQQQARARRLAPGLGQQVILFPDTFDNHFHPGTGLAALDVLEAAGFRPRVPQGFLCCGRPLYDYGMLDTARALLRHTLARFREDIRAGVPFVVLEPSCAAVFRDELVELMPDDQDARRLASQTYALSELLHKLAPDFRTPPLARHAVVQGHCHHKSVLDFGAELAVLKDAGLEVEQPEPSCCGMAGAFGFEQAHYDVSQACGERHLLPAVRAAAPETLVVADGFSCREQLAQGTGRPAMHLAQVLQLALGLARRPVPDDAAPPLSARALAGVGLAALALGGVAWSARRTSPRRRRRLLFA